MKFASGQPLSPEERGRKATFDEVLKKLEAAVEARAAKAKREAAYQTERRVEGTNEADDLFGTEER
jgi:hypothetical protein